MSITDGRGGFTVQGTVEPSREGRRGSGVLKYVGKSDERSGVLPRWEFVVVTVGEPERVAPSK